MKTTTCRGFFEVSQIPAGRKPNAVQRFCAAAGQILLIIGGIGGFVALVLCLLRGIDQ